MDRKWGHFSWEFQFPNRTQLLLEDFGDSPTSACLNKYLMSE